MLAEQIRLYAEEYMDISKISNGAGMSEYVILEVRKIDALQNIVSVLADIVVRQTMIIERLNGIEDKLGNLKR